MIKCLSDKFNYLRLVAIIDTVCKLKNFFYYLFLNLKEPAFYRKKIKIYCFRHFNLVLLANSK